MADQIEQILFCYDCMTKHARDLLHHAEQSNDSELKNLAEKAFDISSEMVGVKDKKLYSDIRDLEHHVEDLLTGLRDKRKKIQYSGALCTVCGNTELLKDIKLVPMTASQKTETTPWWAIPLAFGALIVGLYAVSKMRL
jgi:hypothetical protein